MKIIIIGANGQLGSDCVSLFSKRHEVIGCDFPHIDITKKDSITSYLTGSRVDVIVNCAAYTAVDNCEEEQDVCWQVNCDGPKFLAQTADQIGARLIHVSTDYVFDGMKTIPAPYIESDTPNPLSQYGKSKLAGEYMVAEHLENHIILRTAWLYSHSGANFLKTMLKLALKDPKRELKVVDDQYGSLTWSSTLALQIGALLSHDIKGIVHSTSEGYSSWYDGAKFFLDTIGVPYTMRPCTTAEYPTPAHRPANSILENRICKQADISTFVSWQEDIEKYVADHREELLQEAQLEISV